MKLLFYLLIYFLIIFPGGWEDDSFLSPARPCPSFQPPASGQISHKPTSGAVAEPFGGGQILAQESHSRPPPTGVNGYFRERLPPRRDQRHPEDWKFTFGM